MLAWVPEGALTGALSANRPNLAGISSRLNPFDMAAPSLGTDLLKYQVITRGAL